MSDATVGFNHGLTMYFGTEEACMGQQLESDKSHSATRALPTVTSRPPMQTAKFKPMQHTQHHNMLLLHVTLTQHRNMLLLTSLVHPMSAVVYAAFFVVVSMLFVLVKHWRAKRSGQNDVGWRKHMGRAAILVMTIVIFYM